MTGIDISAVERRKGCHMKPADLIATLGDRLKIEDLVLSEQGVCSVFFDDDEVVFECNDDRLFIFAEIGSAQGRQDLYLELMQANHLGLGAAYGSIGLDVNKESFTQTRVFEGDITYGLFEKRVADFIIALRYWKRYLEG